MKDIDWEKAVPAIRTGDHITPIIHQTYPTKVLPDILRKNVIGLTTLNPGWEHRLYDDDDVEFFIKEQYGSDIFELYERINPAYGACRADLFRYLVVYVHGGIYLDIKSTFTTPVDHLLRRSDQFILSHWSNGDGEKHEGFGLHPDLAYLPRGEYQQWHVIASPGHPFLRAVILRVLQNIANYRPWDMGVGRIGAVRVTGAIAYTNAIHPLVDKYPCRILNRDGDIGLSYSIEQEYVHTDIFKRHYSTITTPVVRLPSPAKPLALAYTLLKRLQTMVRGLDSPKKQR